MGGAALRLATRLAENPSYIFGRFASVRRAFALSQSLSRRPRDTIEIGPLYKEERDTIDARDSKLISTSRSVEEHCAALKRNAWSDGVQLSNDAIESLRAFAHTAPVTFRRSLNVFETIESVEALSDEQRSSVTTAALDTAWKNDTIRSLVGDKSLLAIISAYLGYPPKLVMPYFFWSFQNTLSIEERIALNQTVLFHYDVQGYNFAYLSFYLYPTNRNNGAHVLVEGSHRKKKLGHLLGSARLSDAGAEAYYGNDQIVTIEGDAGEGFFEDTSCFHKALPPADDCRLMLQFRYL